jgi:hypothetical protein
VFAQSEWAILAGECSKCLLISVTQPKEIVKELRPGDGATGVKFPDFFEVRFCSPNDLTLLDAHALCGRADRFDARRCNV